MYTQNLFAVLVEETALPLNSPHSMSCSLLILTYLALKMSPFFFDLYSAITCGWVQRYGSVEIRSRCENKILEMSRVLFTDKYYGESTSPSARCCLAISQTCINVPCFTLKWSLYYFNKSRYFQTKLFHEGRKCSFANMLMLTGYCFFQT